jgi:hypothetical protein
MEDLKTIKSTAESLTDHVSDYIETYVKLAVVNATQKATGIAAVSLTGVLLTVFFVFVLLFSGIGLGFWIGDAMNNVQAGFFIVSAFYLVCGLIIYAFREKIVFPLVRNTIIRKVYEDH